METERRGLLIAFEGIDGAGTTTQAAALRHRLSARTDPVVVTAEPSAGPVGMLVRSVLRGRVMGRDMWGRVSAFDRRALALLFAADRLDHVACEIEPVLRHGGVVICDRYILSSLAYQSLDAPRDWVATLNCFAPVPDLTVFLNVPVEVALARIGRTRAGREVFETAETLGRVAEAYREVLASDLVGPVVMLDGTLTREEVADRVFSAVEPLLTRVS